MKDNKELYEELLGTDYKSMNEDQLSSMLDDISSGKSDPIEKTDPDLSELKISLFKLGQPVVQDIQTVIDDSDLIISFFAYELDKQAPENTIKMFTKYMNTGLENPPEYFSYRYVIYSTFPSIPENIIFKEFLISLAKHSIIEKFREIAIKMNRKVFPKLIFELFNNNINIGLLEFYLPEIY